MLRNWGIILCCVMLCGHTCRAELITTLHNTGIGEDGLPLADGMIDPHYQLIVNPNGTGPQVHVVMLERFPGGYWFPNTAASKWVAPQADYGDLETVP
jgi:hypothetical protein